jgi:dTDP-4-dehydrorhamnose reductase
MRCLVFGGEGLLGRALAREARRRGDAVLALPQEVADIERPGELLAWAGEFRPTAIVNAAALTRVDDCEGSAATAMAVNGTAVAHVASTAAAVGARLVQVSTDYVFDGTARAPYPEDAPTGPRTAYGASKLAGERQALASPGALVVRTSWLFGRGAPNFVDTMLAFAARGERRIAVVDDQTGAPTYAPHLAAAILDLLARGAEGIVHYRDREPVTWAGFARTIFEEWLPEVEIVPVSTAEVPRPAPRPAYSVLDVAKVERILGRKVAPWHLGLVEHLSHTRPIRRH